MEVGLTLYTIVGWLDSVSCLEVGLTVHNCGLVRHSVSCWSVEVGLTLYTIVGWLDIM